MFHTIYSIFYAAKEGEASEHQTYIQHRIIKKHRRKVGDDEVENEEPEEES